jgi:thiol-disulfide isomerase/thioredoxin
MRASIVAITVAAVAVAGVLVHVLVGSARATDEGGGDMNARYVIDGTAWINSPPLKLSDLKGKVVLVDFWEYTCINCIRTLPYVKGWWARYRDKGLVIIGVHSPEFAFGKKLENVQEAVKRFGITYPVVLDNDYNTWRSFGNNFWPHEYLFDATGRLRHEQIGEGGYQETEKAIQTLLTEAGATGPWLDPISPVRAMDKPGSVCYRTTPETYLGYFRGTVGNASGLAHDQIVEYRAPNALSDDHWYLDGPWLSARESVSAGAEGARLVLRYTAAQVYLVMHAPISGAQKVYVGIGDGTALQTTGTDLQTDEQGRTYINVDANRMYTVVDNAAPGTHDLILTAAGPGVEMFAFTFGASCQ